MNKALKVLVAIVGLFLLAACGESSGSTVSTGDSESAERSITELQEFFEANPWQLVDRTGFDTEQLETLITFEVIEPDDTITITLVDCGWVNIHAIEWNDEGFALTDSQNSIGGYGTESQDCFDDIQQLLIRGRGSDQFDVEIADDGNTAVLDKGSRTLTLQPTPNTSE